MKMHDFPVVESTLNIKVLDYTVRVWRSKDEQPVFQEEDVIIAIAKLVEDSEISTQNLLEKIGALDGIAALEVQHRPLRIHRPFNFGGAQMELTRGVVAYKEWP